MMAAFLRDFRFALRLQGKSPALTALAVLALALGIGTTSAVFDLIHGVLLTPPPYARPERAVLVSPARTDGQPYLRDCSGGQLLDFQEQAKTFDFVAGYGWTFDFLTLPNGSQSLRGMEVTKEYFNVVGVQPRLGRAFQASDAPASYWDQTVIILGHNLWQRTFHGDPKIIGQPVQLGIFQKPLTVVGVMPPGLRFLPSPSAAHEPNYDFNAPVDFWIPMAPDPAKPKDTWFYVVGRLRPGAMLAGARAELRAISAREARADHDLEGITAQAQPLAGELNREGRRLLLPLFGAVTLVFLAACLNVSGLLLARGLQRQREYTVRCALGAQRAQLFGQVLTESLLPALAGGVLGMGLAFLIVRVLKAVGGHAIPRLDAVVTGWPVLLFCLGSAVLAAGFAGLAPALRAASLNPAHALRGARAASAGRGERRLLGAVAVLQTAISLALLVGTVLLVRTANTLARLDPGFNTRNLLTMNVTDVKWGNYFDFHERALARLAALPGVKDAAFAWGVPLTGDSWINAVEIDGQPQPAKLEDQVLIPVRSVTPNYFDLLGQKILAGRNFSSTHASPTNGSVQARVAIINQAMAESCFPNANPIGKRFHFARRKDNSVEIIGVAANARTEALDRPAGPEIYCSFWEALMRTKRLIVQTASDPRPLAPAIQRELRAIEPTIAIENVKTLEQIREDSIALQTFAMRLLVGFSAIATTLALVGIYGVISLSVGSRTREIAIRMALGAQKSQVLNLVLREGFRLMGVSLLVGTALALVLAQMLKAFLFGVGSTDLATFAGVGTLFTAVALLACYLPARRAAQVDPLVALRND